MSVIKPQEVNRQWCSLERELTVRQFFVDQADGAHPSFRTTLPAESSGRQSST